MIRFAIAFVGLTFCQNLAWAQSFPALYDVIGVAADDVLNIRQSPTADAAIVGSYSPDRTAIEVLRRDVSGSWAQVNVGERTGWTSMRFLQASGSGGVFPDVSSLHCAGTEPFWSLDAPRNQAAKFRLFDNPTQDYPSVGWHAATGRGDRVLLDLAAGTAAVVRQVACSDGMSERGYGLQVDLIIGFGSQPKLFTGCCSITPK